MKKLKKHAVSAFVASGKMDQFSAPAKKKMENKPGELMGKLVRIVDDSSHLAGHLIDVKSHEGSKIMGQPVFKAQMKEFMPQAEKAPHQIVCDESQVVEM